MSGGELERVEVMGRVASGDLKLTDAAVMLELSYRQAKRLWRCYRQVGRKGLKHGNAGRPSNRGKPMKLRRRVLHLIKKKYSGSEAERFGPTLAAEHLAEEDGIVMDHETLRRWMLAERLWSRQRKRKKHCQRRERKAHFGELVQLDGSFHDWLEGRGPGGCLMDMVDDATSCTQARLGKEETIWAAAGVLRVWIEKYGVPRALYTDWKNVYKRKATPAEQLRGEVPVTQFGRMCQKLGIRILAASSPQAKGRVERNHGVHQDRLVKKLRRKQIASYEAANQYLEQEYLPQHNRRFAQAAGKEEDYHGRRPSRSELQRIFRLETQRGIGNDWVVRHHGRFLQLRPKQGHYGHYGPTQAKALVCEWEDGTTEVHYRGERLAFQELAEARKHKVDDSGKDRVAVPWWAKAHKPSQDHPWRRAYITMKPNGPVKAEMPVRMAASL
jgi:helix-turn-helix protein